MHRTGMQNARIKMGLKQRELAALIGVTEQKVGRLEWSRDRMTNEMAEKIAAALDVEVSDLAGGGS